MTATRVTVLAGALFVSSAGLGVWVAHYASPAEDELRIARVESDHEYGTKHVFYSRPGSGGETSLECVYDASGNLVTTVERGGASR